MMQGLLDSLYKIYSASSACISMAFGCVGGGILSDRYGRKFTLLITAIPFVIGWIILGFANDVTLVIVGRVLTGLCGGLFRSLCAVYLGEISQPTNRPFFIFSLSLSGIGGILFIHVLGGYLTRKIACLITCLPILLGLCLLFLIKESPLWLIYKGRLNEGVNGFLWFRGNDEASQKELADVLEKQKNRSPEMSLKEGVQALFSKSFMRPLLTAFLLFMSVQFSGVNTLGFYAQDLLKDTFSGEQDSFMLMLVTDSARMLGVVLLFLISKYMRRRKTHLGIGFLIVILLIALIVYIAVKPDGLAWLAITVLIIYVALGSLMVGLSWSFIAEIFPSNLRGLGAGLGASTSFFLLFISVMITPIITNHFGILATYSTFAVVTFIALLFLYFLLPHNDGKSLQEIEDSYDKK